MADLTEIIDPPTEEEVAAEVLAGIARKENPVTDWNEGAILRTAYELEREIIFDLVSTALPTMAEGSFTDTAEGEWATDLARYWYARDRGQAVVGIQTVTLACSAGYGPYTITAGRLILLGTDGSRWIAASGGTLSPLGTLTIDATAEGPGAARGIIAALETPLAGVTIQSAAIKIIALVPQFGADEEGDQALMERCDTRWPDLDTVGIEDRVVKWAKAGSTEVTRVKLVADGDNPGGVVVVIAGVSGAVSGGAVTAVQTYIDARQAITDLNTALNASNLNVTTLGSVTVAAERLLDVQAAADAAWAAYLAGTQIGGKVRRAELTQAIMDAGAIDTDAELDSAGPDGNLTLASDQAPVPDDTLANSLTWVVL